MTSQDQADRSATFAEFVRRIRAGDDVAAAELVRRYEPVIRREVRLHLDDRRLCRVFDSLDVCQSVLASFFVRTAAGQYDLDDPAQLVSLLVGMVRRKLAEQVRKQYRRRRDARRRDGRESAKLDRAPGRDAEPAEILVRRELLDQVRQRLSAEERQLAEWRGEGVSWSEIASRLGGTAQSRRMQLSRAIDRVAEDLGLEE